MDVSTGGFKSPNPLYNAKLTDAMSYMDLVKSAGYQGCFLAAAPNGMVDMGQFVPHVQGDQQNTNARDVDPSNDMSGTPTTVPFACVLWIESSPSGKLLQGYYEVGLGLFWLGWGRQLSQILV